MNVLQEYKLHVDHVNVSVKIIKPENEVPTYFIKFQEFHPATKAFIEEIKDELVENIKMTATEVLDAKSLIILKERFKEKANKLIQKKIPHIHTSTKKYIVGSLLHEMLGLGHLELLLGDEHLEEIVVNSSKEPLYVFHKKYKWLMTNVRLPTEAKIMNYAHIIARRVGRQINTLNPLLDAHLMSGDRANAVLYPISTKGNIITIRKFARDPWTVVDFVKNGTCSSYIFALLWTAIQYEMNMLISGGTAAGKTSMLNVLSAFFPPAQRIISIEDTREIQLPQYLHWIPMTTKQDNTENKGSVTMLDLLINSLRMRPDRIIVGEMRRKREAEVLFEGMNTGHSVYATIHADSVQQTVRRLVNPPIELPEMMLDGLNLNVVMFRDRRSGKRIVHQIGEFVVKGKGKESHIEPNILFEWDPKTKKQKLKHKSSKLYKDLTKHTVLSINKLEKEIQDKKKIIDWMVKHELEGVDKIGKIVKEYYLNSKNLMKAILANKKPKDIL